MKTYKIKSFAYFVCFVAALFFYYNYNIKLEAEQMANTKQETFAEVQSEDLSSTDFADADEVKQ